MSWSGTKLMFFSAKQLVNSTNSFNIKSLYFHAITNKSVFAQIYCLTTNIMQHNCKNLSDDSLHTNAALKKHFGAVSPSLSHFKLKDFKKSHLHGFTCKKTTLSQAGEPEI
ncbi:hypothetical protein RF11_02428 [Thelohanellus kitauei]|uniref:Uncharacterized protein n=1 Tax=Thelohanellus kitauei TaxID=669202 RepID=A0A0C2IN03_THEKT|nr:hypothetical protein RF11_02428 [Thelohanellus kitauei]